METLSALTHFPDVSRSTQHDHGYNRSDNLSQNLDGENLDHYLVGVLSILGVDPRRH